MPFGTGVLTSGEHGMAGQFGAVVADAYARQRRLLSSSVRNLAASDTVMPPYFAFQL